jgi:SAM-dependent methyltransferase
MTSQLEIDHLIESIDSIDRISDEDWMSTLSDRKLKELEFHDLDRDRNRVEQTQSSDTYEKFYGNKKYYMATKRSNSFVQDWIKKEAAGKIFLDYACGNAIFAAGCGAALSLGFDISGVSVKNAREAAVNAAGGGNTLFSSGW